MMYISHHSDRMASLNFDSSDTSQALVWRNGVIVPPILTLSSMQLMYMVVSASLWQLLQNVYYIRVRGVR
jgi:hypothetical protein